MPRRPRESQDRQSKRFVEAAHEIGADEDPETFKDRLKRLMSAPAPKAAAQKRKVKAAKK